MSSGSVSRSGRAAGLRLDGACRVDVAKSEDSNGANRSNDGAASVADRAGRYEYVERTAEGTFGSVWKARVTSGAEVGRVVAIRRIARQGLNAAQVERLTSAGFSAMEVRHPKIAAVLDVVVGESEIAVVSELVEGVRLRDLLHSTAGKGSNCPPEAALKMAVDLLEAVRGAKAEWQEIFPEDGTEEELLLRRCVHGGLLPDTVLVANFGETMLTDLGLTGTAMTMPLLSDRLEVVAYRAPEEHEGNTDERSDIFRIGVFLYELITNKALYAPPSLARPTSSGLADATQIAALRKRVATMAVPRLDTLPRWKGTAVKPLADVLARALERDPNKRFQSLDEMIGAILKLGSRLGNEQTVASFLARHEPIIASKAEPPGRTSVDSVRDTIPPVSTSPTVPPIHDALPVSNRPTMPGETPAPFFPPQPPPPPRRSSKPPSKPPVPPAANVPPPPFSLTALVDEPITVPGIVAAPIVERSRKESDASDNLPTQPRGFPIPPPPPPTDVPTLRRTPPAPPSRQPSVLATENKTDLTSSESLSAPQLQTRGISPKIIIAGVAAAVALVGIGVAVKRGAGEAEKSPQAPAVASPPAGQQHKEAPPVIPPPSAQPAAAQHDAGARAATSSEPKTEPAAEHTRSESTTAPAPASEKPAATPKRYVAPKKPFRPTGI